MSYYNVATLEEPMEERAQFSTDWVDQQPVFLSAGTTVMSADFFIEAAPVLGTQTIPASFWNALSDFAAERVVEDKIALNQPPPGA